MSFVNKIKGWAQKASPADPVDDDAAFADAFPQGGAAVATDLPLADVEAAAAFDVPPSVANDAHGSGSIISEAMPSELADFSETRVQGADTAAAPLGAALPLIGKRPAGEQQRILLLLLGIGLVGLIVLTIYSFVSSKRGSEDVAATGQALMQSQRLAKSVSQALVGSSSAFPEVKESVDVLASNVRSLKTGQGPVPAAPSGAQDALDAVMPLVDRAEKNAGIVWRSRRRSPTWACRCARSIASRSSCSRRRRRSCRSSCSATPARSKCRRSASWSC